VGGVERYATDLIRSVVAADPTNRYVLFTPPRGAPILADLASSRVRLQTTLFNSRWYFVPVGLPAAVLRHRVDLLHATFSVAPWCPGQRIVLTVHDVGPDVHPEFFPAGIRRRFRWLTAAGVARATVVVVPSEATRRELLAHYDVKPEKVRVVPEGVNSWFLGNGDGSGASPRDDSIPDEFILAVGRFHARKNLERFLEAFALFKRRHRRSGVKVVLAGRDMYHQQRVMDAIARLGLTDDVVFPGHVDDVMLRALYRRARLFAFPSVHEGFGLPLLEAFACGVPVLGGNRSATPEVAGDAAFLVDPYDVEAMADGIDRLLHDGTLRRTLVERGTRRLGDYSWETVARRMLALYNEALGTVWEGIPA
jgi:glycosyltransferase involved in cell wall biosynthesis